MNTVIIGSTKMEREDLKEKKTQGWSKNSHKIRVDQEKDIVGFENAQWSESVKVENSSNDKSNVFEIQIEPNILSLLRF